MIKKRVAILGWEDLKMFQFNFGADDQEKHEQHENESIQTDLLSPNLDPEFMPKKWTANELLLDDQVPLRISFSMSNAGKQGLVLPRRDVFDVQYWLMKNDKQTLTEEIMLKNSEDIKAYTYEGGLKVWECTYDVLDMLSEQSDELLFANDNTRILELGCGSGMISSYILYRFLTRAKQGSKHLQLYVADYNYSVLRLATVYTLLLTWLLARGRNIEDFQVKEINIEQSMVDEFCSDLKAQNVNLVFVSGGWCQDFISLCGEQSFDLVLGSETIYSPETLPLFTETMLKTLKNPSGQALIAAKNVYFGVGGGIPEFVTELEKRSAIYSVLPVNNANVGRSIVTVEAK